MSRFWPVAPAKISHTHELRDVTVAMQLHYIFLSALKSELSLSLPPGRSELPQGPGFCSMGLKIWYRKAWSCSDRVPLLDLASTAWEQSLIIFWYHLAFYLLGDTASYYWALHYGGDILLRELPSSAH